MDRLLGSLRKHLFDYENFAITVVDDGTEKTFLEYLSKIYPEVLFLQLSEGVPPDTNCNNLRYVTGWRNFFFSCQAKYVLLLEEDQWLVRPLDLYRPLAFMEKTSARVLQLIWPDNRIEGASIFTNDSCEFSTYLPSFIANATKRSPRWCISGLVTSPLRVVPALASLLTRKVAALHWRSLAMVNPIAGAIFTTSHWLALWKHPQRRINENIQISRALQEIRHSKTPNRFLASSKHQFFYTTYSSSSSSALQSGIHWDRVNFVLSTRWMNGHLQTPPDTMDWSEGEFEEIIEEELGPLFSSAYRTWVSRFKQMHAGPLEQP